MSELFDIPILLDKTRQGTRPRLLPVFVNKVNTELQSRMSNAFFCANLFLVTYEPYSPDIFLFFFITLLSELTVAKSLVASQSPNDVRSKFLYSSERVVCNHQV